MLPAPVDGLTTTHEPNVQQAFRSRIIALLERRPATVFEQIDFQDRTTRARIAAFLNVGLETPDVL
jgi:hypothetical protein